VSEDQTPDPLSLFEEETEKPPPSAESVLRYLGQFLSVAKTLKRFPSLTPKYLQEILLRSADRVKEGSPPSPSSFLRRKQGLPRGPSRKESPNSSSTPTGFPWESGEAGAGAVISDSQAEP